jgi:hypothetical protein
MVEPERNQRPVRRNEKQVMLMGLHAFGTTDDGLTVTEVRLALPSGLAISILNRGAVVRDLKIPTRNGASRRVVLGYADLAGYCADQGYLGPSLDAMPTGLRRGVSDSMARPTN